LYFIVSKVGTPFRKATEAVLLSTFHYINTWQYPWTDAEVGRFQGNDGIPYLKVQGNFLIAQEDEFTAVSVPLEVKRWKQPPFFVLTFSSVRSVPLTQLAASV